MSASANPDNDAPVPCANDCGFWGRPSTGNFCSSCYKQKIGKNEEKKEVTASLKSKGVTKSVDLEVDAKKSIVKDIEEKAQAQTQAQEQAKVEVEVKVDAKKDDAKVVPKPVDGDEDKPTEPVRKVQKNRMRCFSCRKKVGLTGTECRCGYVFCGMHRYPEEHNCDFDFHKLAQEKVATKTGGAVVSKVQGEEL